MSSSSMPIQPPGGASSSAANQKPLESNNSSSRVSKGFFSPTTAQVKRVAAYFFSAVFGLAQVGFLGAMFFSTPPLAFIHKLIGCCLAGHFSDRLYKAGEGTIDYNNPSEVEEAKNKAENMTLNEIVDLYGWEDGLKIVSKESLQKKAVRHAYLVLEGKILGHHSLVDKLYQLDYLTARDLDLIRLGNKSDFFNLHMGSLSINISRPQPTQN